MVSDTEAHDRSRCQTPFMIMPRCPADQAVPEHKKAARRKFEVASSIPPAKRVKKNPIYVANVAPIGYIKNANEKRDTSAPNSPSAISVELPESASSEGRIRRSTREVFSDLLAKLDAVLPADHRSVPRPNGAGSRSLGSAGRSVHDVLTDVVRAVAARRSEYSDKADIRSNGAVAIEVSMPGWIISAMSPGAKHFFKDAPWGSVEGQSLADFVQWEDLDDFNALCLSPPCKSVELEEKKRIRLLHWTGVNGKGHDKVCPSQYTSDEDQCLVPQDAESDVETVVASGSGFGCSAFDDDPLLSDQPDLAETTPFLRCKYIDAQVQVLQVTSSVPSDETTEAASSRALVAISVL